MKKLLFLLFLFFIIASNAQSIYDFQAENISYEDLTGSTSLNNGSVWDNPGYTIPLGFGFNLGSYAFDTIYILEWSIGGYLSSDPVYGDIVPLLVPVGQNLIDLGYTSGISQSNISYKTEGATGGQILKIEWNNVGFFADKTNSDFMNFQLWLYEGTNIIEYRYGPSSINNPNFSFEGSTGPHVGLLTSFNIDTQLLEDNGYFMSEDPANPIIITLEAGDSRPIPLTAVEGMIPDGAVYRFMPQPLSILDFSKIDCQIYPNPTSDYLNIQTNTSNYNFNIYNSFGQVMNTASVENRIDISNLSNGIYFLKIETESGSAIKKFIKQ